MQNEVTKLCIRSDLNMLFATSRFITTILDMADTMPLARETLRKMSESLMLQAAEVYGRVIRDYADDNEYAGLAEANKGIMAHADE